MEESLEKYERSRVSGERLSQPPPTENRERLPLRVRVRPGPSGGYEIGTEMLTGSPRQETDETQLKWYCTFRSLAEYPFEARKAKKGPMNAVAELCVDYSVPEY